MADNLSIMQEYFGRIAAQDFEGATEFLSSNITAHVSGRSEVSGDYHGIEEFLGYITRAMALVDSLDISPHDLLVGDDHAVALTTLTLERGGESFTSNRVVVYHLDDGKISELWIIDTDQQGLDEFVS